MKLTRARAQRHDRRGRAAACDEAGVGVDDLALRRPTLDDVFLSLTGHAAEPADDERGGGGMRRLVSDTLVIAERNLVRLPRAPDLLLAFTVQPVMFVLLFVYVFGGAIRTPGYDYVDFLIPGIIVQNIAFGGFVTALGLNEDLHKGLIDRFRSLPMARPAVLAGRTLADVVTNPLSVARAARHRPDHRLLVPREPARDRRRRRPAAALRLRVLVGLRAARAARLLARGGQLGRLHRRLPAHVHLLGVRAGRLDARARCSGFAEVNPFTIVVDAMRALWIGAPAGNNVWGAVVWSFVILAVFAPLAVRRYRRAAGR